MARIKIELPEKFYFQTVIPIRITDLNYGGHVGNDSILTIAHEARAQFLHSLQFTELNMAGVALIMGDAAIEFKAELFYGDLLQVSVSAGEFSRVGFDIFYKMEKEVTGKKTIVAIVKTGMVCFDYEKKKVTAMPEAARQKFESGLY